tara:strand:- start:292 stop:414 length:123 start_codon:yes stop_codon:yes gene_type:complete
MQKIIFIIISLLIFGLVTYVGISALIRGKKSKDSKKNKDE